MQFGLFFQHQLPRPWTEGVEVRNFADHLEQCVLAERLGFHSIWVTEHHYLEEYSHSSAPAAGTSTPTPTRVLRQSARARR